MFDCGIILSMYDFRQTQINEDALHQLQEMAAENLQLRSRVAHLEFLNQQLAIELQLYKARFPKG